jgi:hypothetical protein
MTCSIGQRVTGSGGRDGAATEPVRQRRASRAACGFALIGIGLVIGSVFMYFDNRDLAAHWVRTQGRVLEVDEGS